MGKLRDRAEELGIEVDGRWSNGTLTRKIAEVETRTNADQKRAVEPETTVTVRLLKHCHMTTWYEIIGHEDDGGKHVDGPAPAPMPGVEFNHKLWAGTIVKMGSVDAKRLIDNVIVERLIDRDPDSKEVIRARNVQRRKPLAEVVLDWNAAEAAAG